MSEANLSQSHVASCPHREDQVIVSAPDDWVQDYPAQAVLLQDTARHKVINVPFSFWLASECTICNENKALDDFWASASAQMRTTCRTHMMRNDIMQM